MPIPAITPHFYEASRLRAATALGGALAAQGRSEWMNELLA